MLIRKLALLAALMSVVPIGCDSVPAPVLVDNFPDECILESGSLGILTFLSEDEFLGIEIFFDGVDLIVDDFVVGTVIIENDIISLTIDEPFALFDPEFDTVFDAEFDGVLTAGDCGTDLLFEGVGTITLGDTVSGTVEIFEIADITLPPNFDL